MAPVQKDWVVQLHVKEAAEKERMHVAEPNFSEFDQAFHHEEIHYAPITPMFLNTGFGKQF